GCDRLDGLGDLVGRDRDLDFDLGQETHGVFGAAIDFRVALLPAISLDLRDRQAVNADGGQRVADFFKLERLDDRHNNFHGPYSPLGLGPDPTERSRLTSPRGDVRYAGTAAAPRIKCRARSLKPPNRL